MRYIVLSLHGETVIFYRENQSVIFVTSHLFTFQAVLIKHSVPTSRTQSRKTIRGLEIN